jgi:Ca-activated chloride channel family protein
MRGCWVAGVLGCWVAFTAVAQQPSNPVTKQPIASLWRETNSHAANARGVKAFAEKRYVPAAAAFGAANSIAPSPQRAFNLGTAQIAAGNREQGSSTLARAMTDPHLRADALFNRGNSALEAKAFDYAIHDYVQALKLRPSDAGAKRNLEIALARKRAMQRQSSGSRQGQQGSSPREQPQPQAQAAPDRQQNRDANLEPLLRSIQQQEEEELSRMHRARAEKGRVGW